MCDVKESPTSAPSSTTATQPQNTQSFGFATGEDSKREVSRFQVEKVSETSGQQAEQQTALPQQVPGEFIYRIVSQEYLFQLLFFSAELGQKRFRKKRTREVIS